MGFKISLLFVFATFSVISTVYLYTAKGERSLRPNEEYRKLHGRPTYCDIPYDDGRCCEIKHPNGTCIKKSTKLQVDNNLFRFWYNKELKICDSFLWKMCSQNDNNFKYWQDCMDLCY